MCACVCEGGCVCVREGEGVCVVFDAKIFAL